MKKSILFSLPLVATLLFSCSRKGKTVPVEEAADVASAALVSMAGQSAIGIELTGNVTYEMLQRSFNTDSNYHVTSLNTMDNMISVTNLKTSINVNNLNKTLDNILGSASLSATVAHTASYEGNEENHPQGPLPFKSSTIKANAYLENGVAYFDHDQRCADFVNDFILYPMGIRDNYTDSKDKKYFINIPTDGIPPIGVNTILASALSIYGQDINKFLVDGQYFDTYTAKKISNTRYSLTAETDLRKYVYPSSFPTDKQDRYLISASVTYDTNKGIEELVVSADVHINQTFKEIYDGMTYLPYSDLASRYGNESVSLAEMKGQLKFKFNYGNKVKVNTLKDKSEYNIDLLELTGGNKQPVPGGRVDYSTFLDELSKANNKFPPLSVDIDYFVTSSYQYASNHLYVDFNVGPQEFDTMDQSIFEIVMQFSDSSYSSQFIYSMYSEANYTEFYIYPDSTNKFVCYLGFDNSEAISLSFNSYGHLTYFYEMFGENNIQIETYFKY